MISTAKITAPSEGGKGHTDTELFENAYGYVKDILLAADICAKSKVNMSKKNKDIVATIETAITDKSPSLNLRGLKLASIPKRVFELVWLTDIDAYRNSIRIISSSITRLENLRRLQLRYNSLEQLPPEIGQLSNLRALNVSMNRLQELPPEIGNLTNLESLTLDGNQITYLPKEFGKLTNLRLLNISGNLLRELPNEIERLTELHSLDLSNNKLKELPIGLSKLSNLKELILQGNFLNIPPEILKLTSEPQKILSYYFATFRKIDGESIKAKSLNEIKLLFVGQGSVGKTSVIRRITLDKFNSSEIKTDGISIHDWQVSNQFEIENLISKIKLNIWDFGGQEIMHATHQFFLTKRSLYLLVLDSRLTQEENRVEYWLKIIQSFGSESPVLIVGNKIDQHPLDIERTSLQKKYPNIVGILETSAATGAGIEELKAAIAEQVNNLPHVRDLLPETWFTVKTKLEELGRASNFITHDKYLELCTENEVSDETSQRTLIGFLHDLGVVLHFQDDRRLAELGILNPQWVTNGVYKILNDKALFANKGVLTLALLDQILSTPEYPQNKRLFIVDMMKKFELCYDIDRDNFLIPDLLPKDEPELKFNGIPAFEYAYPVLPSSIITRFIVRMNQKIDDGLVWRTGVVLKIGENKALVKADIEDRKITIAIEGLEHTRRDALSAIRYQLDEIHNSIKGLDPQKKIPVPNARRAEPLKYEYLLKLERAGQETLLVEDGDNLVTINIRQVLSAVENESQRKETGGNVTNIIIGGDVNGGNIVSGNNNVVTQNIQKSFNKADAADIQAELKETLKQLATAVEAMSKSLPAEQAAEAVDDLGKLVEEATKPKPNKKWYSVSVDGLVKAAENIGKVGEPVIDLSRKVLSLLTGGVIK